MIDGGGRKLMVAAALRESGQSGRAYRGRGNKRT